MRRSIWFLLILGCRPTGPEGEFHTDSATGMFRAWERRASLGSTVCIASIRNLAERDMDDWFVQASCAGPAGDAANLAPSVFLPFRGFNRRVITPLEGLVNVGPEIGSGSGPFVGYAEWEIQRPVRSREGFQGRYRGLIIHRLVVEPGEVCDVLDLSNCGVLEGGEVLDHRVWAQDDALSAGDPIGSQP